MTKLLVYDLLEEGTQCPNCHTEILPNRSVYLHRGCSNIVCALCFEINLLQEVGSDLCLICKGTLAEPCAEDALPNWRFTYTTISRPEGPTNSSHGTSEFQGSFGIPLSNDTSAGPRSESNPPNERNDNAQYENGTTIEPQPTSQPPEPRNQRERRNPRKREIDDPQREDKSNTGGQRLPRDRPQKKPKPLQLGRDSRKFPGDGRSPRLKHQRRGPQAQRQQSQSRVPRRPRGNQSQSEGHSDSSQAQTSRPRQTVYRETRPRKRRSYKPYMAGSQAGTPMPRDYRSHMRHGTSHVRDDMNAVE